MIGEPAQLHGRRTPSTRGQRAARAPDRGSGAGRPSNALNLLHSLALQQPPFTEPHRQWPELEVGTADFAFGDIDGDVDVVVVRFNPFPSDPASGLARVIRNEGARGFRPAPIQISEFGLDSTSVALDDFDGGVFFNSGGGVFSAGQQSSELRG